MKKQNLKRSLALALALMLSFSALPLAAQAAQKDASSPTELVATDVTLDETVFAYTGSEIKPNVTVRVNGHLLTLDQDYQLDYADNVEVGEAKVIVTGIPESGYAGTVEHPFFINEKASEDSGFTLIELKDTDVTIEGTEFTYTGKPIEPQVTVTVEGKELTSGRDYAVEYISNLIPGTGTVIVRGIATASETLGYTGEVRIDFTIKPMTEEEYPLVEIQSTDVTIEDTSFPYTGKAIEPKITVTVGGKTLTPGRDYSLKYVNNIEVGTATAIVSGIATATETGGYTGEVKIDFTIEPVYKVTKGDGTSWYQGSNSGLTFTADGKFEDFTGISVNGKPVDKDNYSVKSGSTIVLLKNSYLKELETGTYTITMHFTDGDAEAAFHIEEESANPKTGDSIHLVTAVLFVSLTGLLGTAFACRKKLWK